MTLYKVLNVDGSSFHGGFGTWYLPTGKRPGKWMPKIPDLVLCGRGYHILKPKHLVFWLGPAIWEVEIRGKVLWSHDKGVAEQARLLRPLPNWNDQTARLFACDCAAAVSHIVKDKRIDDCIRTARRFAFGLETSETLSAARFAAWSAADSAAESAARSAAWSAAESAAWSAAESAAWSAAQSAAWSAQSKRLWEYLNGSVDLDAIRKEITT